MLFQIYVCTCCWAVVSFVFGWACKRHHHWGVAALTHQVLTQQSRTAGDECDNTVLRASSPCAHRMRIGAEAMHGEEQEGTQVESLCGGATVDDARMTAHADTLRAAVAEEQEAESGLAHHAYRGTKPPRRAHTVWLVKC